MILIPFGMMAALSRAADDETKNEMLAAMTVFSLAQISVRDGQIISDHNRQFAISLIASTTNLVAGNHLRELLAAAGAPSQERLGVRMMAYALYTLDRGHVDAAEDMLRAISQGRVTEDNELRRHAMQALVGVLKKLRRRADAAMVQVELKRLTAGGDAR